ncbi:MAG TPA: tyrosine-type recombinase/integrase [Methylocystis sp.]
MASTVRRLKKPLIHGDPSPLAEATDDDIKIAAKNWLDRLAAHYREMVDSLSPGEISFETDRIAPSMLEWTEERLDRDRDYYGNTTPELVEREEAEAALHVAGFEGEFSAKTLGRMHRSMEAALDGYVRRRLAELKGEPPPEPVAPSPMFSELVEKFLEEKGRSAEGHRGYAPQTTAQTRASFRFFLGLVGERPVREYAEKDAEQFRLQLLKLPQNFGKSPKHTDPRKAIREADEHDGPIIEAREKAPASKKAHQRLIPRLKMKTVKRHFSSLAQYWAYLLRRGHVGKNIFLGWEFPGTRSNKIKHRDPWTADNLKTVLCSEEWKAYGPLSAGHWLPLIAMHSGMRLDEIAALRVDEDIAEEKGVLILLVQEQIPVEGKEYDPRSKKWLPKTITSIRRVPVHSWLIAHGLRALIERRRREGAVRLFPELKWTARHSSFSADYSHEFSRLKTKLGLGKRIVFHGFRITFRTEISQTLFEEELLNAITGHEDYEDGQKKTKIPDRLIDATVGDAGERGVGAMYDRPLLYKIEILRTVVESFRSPLDLDFLEPLADAVKKAPSDKDEWAENRAPARPGRKPAQDGRAKEKAALARRRTAKVQPS